jgi:glycosyltransferase involved in cell wall biosynthesis
MQTNISVIIPSYNQGRFIERTLRSVMEQSVSPLDCFVHDGGSQDETISVLRRYEGRLRWSSEPDRGQAHAVNKGIQASTGEIIAWINSDDVYYPGAFARVQQFFAENNDVDVLYGDAFYIDADDNQLEPYNTEPWNFDRFKEVCFLCQPAVFFRRRVVEKFGLLDESLQFCLDYEYWLRLAIGGAVFAYLPVKLAGSRWYAQNKTLSNLVAVHHEIIDMLVAKFKKIPAVWMYRYVYALASARQVRRESWRFELLLLWYLVLALFRWHQGIPKELPRDIGKRIGHRLKNIIRRFPWLEKDATSR